VGCVGVLSQSDILRSIVVDNEAVDCISQRVISDIALVRKSLVTCSPDTPAAVAFKVWPMSMPRCSAVVLFLSSPSYSASPTALPIANFIASISLLFPSIVFYLWL
jgi:hypothetical protein